MFFSIKKKNSMWSKDGLPMDKELKEEDKSSSNPLCRMLLQVSVGNY
jgi:hypothetical protein